MESKRSDLIAEARKRGTFNRTSMESKLSRGIGSDARRSLLLIEPVWNRNMNIELHGTTGKRLLIEPVWNRNPEEGDFVRVYHPNF